MEPRRFIFRSPALNDSVRTAACTSADELARDLECFRRAIRAAGYTECEVEWLAGETLMGKRVSAHESDQQAAETIWRS